MSDSVSPAGMPLAEVLPLSLFFAVPLVQNGGAVCYLLAGEPAPEGAQALWSLSGWVALLAWWQGYSARHRIPLVLDMGWFLYVAWWVVVPYFAIRTSGWRAAFLVVLFAGLWLGAYLAYVAVYMQAQSAS